MTPSRLSLKGSLPPIAIVLVGASFLPDNSRRRVVLPAPFAFFLSQMFPGLRKMVNEVKPPISNVLLPEGRLSPTPLRPSDPSWNL